RRSFGKPRGTPFASVRGNGDDGTIEARTTATACRASARTRERGCRFAVIRAVSQRAAVLSGDCATRTGHVDCALWSCVLLCGGGVTHDGLGNSARWEQPREPGYCPGGRAGGAQG